MNIEERKSLILNNIVLLEKDIETLQKNLCELKKDIAYIKTEEDAKRFDSEVDVRKGLKFIEF